MGREATCHLQWGTESDSCRVLLESTELIVRGTLRRRIPISSITDIGTEGSHLTFRVGQDQVSLQLGSEVAGRWAKAIGTMPPTLATKFGVSDKTHLRVLGSIDDPDLQSVLHSAASLNSDNPNLLLARVRRLAELNELTTHLTDTPLWILYEKGPGKDIGEASIRSTLRAAGFIDTKVASVSPKLTALRFQKARPKQ